ncbi:hypothetical protein EV363DRAFT_1404749 [Boletus edulis]|nr:hypothetical protein EV363DRAFT_1404749 [Boletus edulis]
MTDTGKSYHKQCTGEALQTAQRHAADEDITLFAGCFCPFVQRGWAALEYLGIPYKVHEVDPYKKPQELLEVSPKGLTRAPSYASNPDHINRTLVPAFYRYLQAQDPTAQITGEKEFKAAIEALVALFERADKEVGGTGLWKEGGELGWADIMVGPWMFRADKVLKDYRRFEMPEGAKLTAWLKRLFEHPAFKRTCSTDELYLDSYERQVPYAFNRPNTSQVANAINTGRGLP